MSDKQRADHVQAKYWNGFITRTEAQKVFDEQGQVIMQQAMAIQKLDTVITYVTNKLGVTVEDINVWVKQKMEEAQKAQAQQTPQGQAEQVAPVAVDPTPIVLADAN